MNRYGILGILAVACACSGDADKQQTAKTNSSTPATAPGGNPAPEPRDNAADQQKLTELRRSKDALTTRLKLLEEDLKAVEKRHAEEKAASADIGKLRRRWPPLRRDAMTSAARMQRLLKRKAELEKYADSDAAGKLKTLRAERKTIDQRYQDALSGRRKAIVDSARGAVEESPVKRDLDTVRAMKIQWFQATPAARSGKVNAGERTKINSTFRTWLSAQPRRTDVAKKVLAQPLGPKGKTPDNYDFTKLDFYVLMELLEIALDKLNIVAEKKELKAKEKVVNAVEVELDAIDAKIHEELLQGGDELQEYEDLMRRFPDTQRLNDVLQTQASEYSKMLADYRGMRTRHQKELADANSAIADVRKQVKTITAEIRKAS